MIKVKKSAFVVSMILIFTTIVQTNINSGSLFAQSETITLPRQNLTYRELFAEIEKQTTFTVAFEESNINLQKGVVISTRTLTLSQLLTEALKGTNNTYTLKGQHIVVKADPNVTKEESTRKINGTIMGAQREPLPGAYVLIKGTRIGTITDDKGTFTLNVPDNAILQVNYMGFKSIEVSTAGRAIFNIQLEEDTQLIEALVVTALGIKREEKALGYSVQSVSGSSMQTVKSVDAGTSLTGKVAGLLVRNSSEFTEAPDIFIRGERPLIVIDGVPYANMSLRDIPQDDIENISVLKGATASALYGYRGSSGAIMITSKGGMKSKGLSVSINSGTMFDAGYLAIPETQSTFGRVVNTGTNTYARSGDGSWGVPMDGREVIQWDPISKSLKPMPYLPIGKDNFKNFLEQGYVLNNNINVVQQGEYGSFRVSATWVQQKGAYPNSLFDKYTYTIGGDLKFENLTISSALSFNKQLSPNRGFSGYTGYDPMYNLLVWAAPDYDIRLYRDYWVVPNEVQNSSYTSTNNNPYFDRYERTHKINKDILNGNLTMNYDIAKGIKATFRTGFDTYSNRQDITISRGSFQGAGAAKVISNGTEVWGESAKGSYNLGIERGYSFNNDLLLSVNKNYREFVFDGFVGGSLFYRQNEGMEARTQGGLTIPGFYSLKASVNPVAVASTVHREQVNSLYGRLAVSWKNLVYTEATLRNDWSSTLPQTTRSYLYPSVAASFIASELLPKMDWLSFWKLRGSWTVSKTPAGVYAINSVYTITNSVWGNLSGASFPTSIRGIDVRPESSTTFEIGTAVNLWKSRASLDVAYYNKRMYDFIRSTGITPASGFTSKFVNIDEEITRKGVEISANVVPVESRDWRWDISVNWSKYARYYTKLDKEFSADRPWVKVGNRADHYILRDYQKDKDGNIIHNNGLPLYSAYDSLFGYSDPDWIWGIGTNLRYKNWQLTLSMDGRVGGIAQTTTEMYMWRAGSHPKSVTPERMADATTAGSKNYTGKGVKVVSGTVTYDTYGNITSDTRVFAANDIPVTYKTYTEAYHKGTAWGGAPSPVDAYSTTFLKIRELAITYNVPENIAGKIKAKNATISLISNNLFLWAKQFKYSDPDGGSENFADPSLRYIGFNVKLGF